MMRAMEAILAPPGAFVPAELVRTFRIAASDHILLAVLPRLEPALSARAPKVDVHFRPLSAGSLMELEQGASDVALGVFDRLGDSLSSLPLFDDELVPVVRSGHPALGRRVSARAFAKMNHVLVAPYGRLGGPVDGMLAEEGLHRRVVRVLPTFVEAPFVVAHSDHVVTLPRALVEQLSAPLRLRPLSVAMKFPRFTVSMAWPRRLDADPAHTWMRRLLEEVCKACATFGSACLVSHKASPSKRRTLAKPR
jgi:DNA-binding transcriptional LysR family regulator